MTGPRRAPAPPLRLRLRSGTAARHAISYQSKDRKPDGGWGHFKPSPWGQCKSSRRPAIRAFAAANNIELLATPTYASYLNRIESTFGAIDEFVCKNADYLDWDAFAHALANHVRHRNSPTERERRKLEASKRRQRRATKTLSELAPAA